MLDEVHSQSYGAWAGDREYQAYLRRRDRRERLRKHLRSSWRFRFRMWCAPLRRWLRAGD